MQVKVVKKIRKNDDENDGVLQMTSSGFPKNKTFHEGTFSPDLYPRQPGMEAPSPHHGPGGSPTEGVPHAGQPYNQT